MRIRPGASVEELDGFERLHAIRLPDDARFFLQAMYGFGDREWDQEMVEWHPISRWEPITGPASVSEINPESGHFYVFANYCLDAFLYAIRPRPGPFELNTVIGWIGGDPLSWQVAGSFSELLEAYLRDPAVMLGHG